MLELEAPTVTHDAPEPEFCLFGTRFEVGPADATLQRMNDLLTRHGGPATVVLHANLHTIYEANGSPNLRAALDGLDTLVLFEGIGLKLGRFLTSLDWWPDNNGTDLVPALLAVRRKRRLRVALVGGAPGTASRAAESMARKFSDIEVVATENGFADLRPGYEVHTRVSLAAPDLVLFGLGSPLQEVTAATWRAGSTARVLWCVGGLFDLWAGDRRRAPRWVRGCRLEWLWRLIAHPTVMWRRTFIEGPWLARRIAGLWIG